MTRRESAFAAALAPLFVASVWLYMEIRRLRPLAASERAKHCSVAHQSFPKGGDISARAAEAPDFPLEPAHEDGATAPERSPAATAMRQAVPTSGTVHRSAAAGGAGARAMARNRHDWQQQIRALLGRDPEESDDDYRRRLAPLVEASLAMPRHQAESWRREVEEAANVSSGQHDAVDEVLRDAYREALTITNESIQRGELTPYQRNIPGLLSWAGALGGVLGDAEKRIGGVLSPEQLAQFSEQGFDWGSYLGLNVPWEELDPPPPAPASP